MTLSARCVLCSLFAASVIGACSTESGTKPDSSAPAASGAETHHGIGPGMNAAGEVIDPSKVEHGYGRSVTVGDWEGELTGKPAPGTCFTRLQIGMPIQQVMATCGPPTDQGSYLTGKAFIPFYFGSDRFRYELAYKAQGRLIFAGGSIADLSGAHLIWVIYSASDSGYR